MLKLNLFITYVSLQLIIVNFTVCGAESKGVNHQNWIYSKDAKERLSTSCRNQFLGYYKEIDDIIRIPKKQLFFDINQHLPLTDIKQLPSLGDYESCEAFSELPMKYCNLQLYLNQIDLIKNITLGPSVVFKRFYLIWMASAVIGLCVPKQCTENEVKVLQEGFGFIHLNHLKYGNQSIQLDYSVFDVTCDEFNTPQLSFVIWMFILFTTFVVVINLGAMHTKRIYMKNSFMACFNLRQFIKNLFARHPPEQSKFLILNGVTSICTLWILYASAYDANLNFPNADINKVMDWILSLEASSVIMSTMLLYQFQTINGFLLGYNQPSFGTSFLQRIVGVILPMYPLLLIFHTSLSDLGSGPMWFTTRRYIKYMCVNVWPSYLLIQNYYNPERVCTAHTWYMAVDFHLILISPVLFYLLRLSFKMAALIISKMAFMFCFSAMCLAYSMHFEPTLHSWVPEYLDYIFFPTHMRSPVWLFSLLAGYAYKENKMVDYTKYLNKYYKHGCVASGCLIVFVTFFTTYAPFLKISLWFKSWYIGYYNLIWSWMILWVLLVYLENHKETGQLNMIQKLLSRHFFTVLCRLSYGLYLTAPLVQFIVTGSRKEVFDFTTMSNVLDFGHQLIYKILLAVYWYLFIQQPIIALATYLSTFRTK